MKTKLLGTLIVLAAFTALGQPLTGSELWFREGLYVVPEPSATAFAVVGLAILGFHHRSQIQRHS
jgi:hypothetical protein